MHIFRDIHNRDVRLTLEREEHFLSDHPEMRDQIGKVREILFSPEKIVRSKTDSQIELFYRHYDSTPVTQKYLCIVVKATVENTFIITAYFTDSIKKGELLWPKN